MAQAIISVSASPARRLFGIGTLVVLGGLSVFIAVGRGHDSLLWQVFLLLFGLAVLYLADLMRRATALRIDLTEDALVDSTGRELVRIDNIAGVDRGTLAIKPSNGFMIRLKSGGPRAWAPGMWWRLGRRVGVGGITSAGHTKALAEMIEATMRAAENGDET